MVGEVARDQLEALRLPPRGVVGLRELPCALHRLRAPRGEEHPVEVPRREARDPRRQLDRAGVRVTPVGVERELPRLARRRVGELRAAVADVDAEQRGEAVEVALAVLVVHVAPLAPHDHRHLVVRVGAHAREVHPQVAARKLLQGPPRSLVARARRSRLRLRSPKCAVLRRVGGDAGAHRGGRPSRPLPGRRAGRGGRHQIARVGGHGLVSSIGTQRLVNRHSG